MRGGHAPQRPARHAASRRATRAADGAWRTRGGATRRAWRTTARASPRPPWAAHAHAHLWVKRALADGVDRVGRGVGEAVDTRNE
eukprot:scaffold15366_cov90-Isochrysis_galbana.AAC.2